MLENLITPIIATKPILRQYRDLLHTPLPRPTLKQDRKNCRKLVPTKFAERGFNKIDPKVLEYRRRKFILATWKWRPEKVLRCMAVLNGLVWDVAKKNGAAVPCSTGGKTVKRNIINQLIHRGSGMIVTSVNGLTKYARTYWKEATKVSASSIRRMRDEMEQMGLFRVSGVKQGSRSWTVLLSVDFLGLLILQEVLEQAWLGIQCGERTLNELPKHKAGFVRLCWNAAKNLLGREFNRVYGAKIDPRNRVYGVIVGENIEKPSSNKASFADFQNKPKSPVTRENPPHFAAQTTESMVVPESVWDQVSNDMFDLENFIST